MSMGLNADLGVELVSASRREARVRMRMPVTPRHMAATGRVHGGATATIADTALGMGAMLCLPPSATGMAVADMSINFLSSAQVGQTLVADAVRIKGGATTQVWDATVSLEGSGEPVTMVRATAINLYGDRPGGDKPSGGGAEKQVAAAAGASAAAASRQSGAERPRGGDGRQSHVSQAAGALGKNFNIQTMNKQEVRPVLCSFVFFFFSFFFFLLMTLDLILGSPPLLSFTGGGQV